MPPESEQIVPLSTVNAKRFHGGHIVMIVVVLTLCMALAAMITETIGDAPLMASVPSLVAVHNSTPDLMMMALATGWRSQLTCKMGTGAKRVLVLSETGQIISKIRVNRGKQGSLTNFLSLGFCLAFLNNVITPYASLSNNFFLFISVSARNVSAQSADPRFLFQRLLAHGLAVSATPVFTPRSETKP